jgi:membrane peptidoglycan carboxypeptidase
VWIGYDMPRTIIANGYAGELAVPLWGRFMAQATRGDKPDRFKMPATVVPVTVCRLSGKLASDGCRSTIVFDRDGQPTDRSMVYTEYFVRGTEPDDYCPLHTGVYNAVATSGDAAPRPAIATSGGALPTALAPVDHLHEPTPPRGDTHLGDGTPAAVAPAAGAPETPAATPRKRGNWGRVFRR